MPLVITGILKEARNQIRPNLFFNPHPHHVSGQLEFHPYLPKGTPLLREEFKVLSCKRDRRKGLQAQPCPALEEAHQALKGVQAQTIISVIGQMGHKYADLQGDACMSESESLPTSVSGMMSKGPRRLQALGFSNLLALSQHLTGLSSTVRKSSPPRMLRSSSREPPGYSL